MPTEGHEINGDDAPVPAEASFEYRHKSGFYELKVSTNADFPDSVQMAAAGFLEGYLTAEQTYDYYYNVKSYYQTFINDTFKVGRWLKENDHWVRQQVKSHGDDPFWSVVGLLVAQTDGLAAGYTARVADMGPSPTIDRLYDWDFLFINALGDMEDLQLALFPKPDLGQQADRASGMASRQDGNKYNEKPQQPQQQRQAPLSPGQVRSEIAKRGRCSALVKVTPDLSDVLVGHVTWWTYAAMLRVYKHYNLRLSHPAVRNRRISFPSYPGMTSSMDDFYILGSGMVVTETSVDVYNASLYNLVTPASVLSAQRVQAANLLADSGRQWSELAALHNSGTYNNQYMVVDMKRFTPGEPLKEGLLTILEIIPGYYKVGDMTQDLAFGYWPSYNVPYFMDVYNRTGYEATRASVAAHGPEYASAVTGLSYQLSPRAKIFRRDAGTVSDLQGLKRVLRSNGWPSDTFSAESPWEAICARGDLDADDPDFYGCYDGKATNYRLTLQMAAEAINGPTRDGGLPPFSWHGRYKHIAHRGMIETFDSQTWEEMRP